MHSGVRSRRGAVHRCRPYADGMKRVWWILVAVVAVVVLAVVADRVTASMIGSGIEDSLTDNGAVDPAVEVGGFPVLTQLAGGELRDVSGTADAVNVGGVTIKDVAFAATDVGTSAPHRAAEVSASGLLPVASLEAVVAGRMGDGATVEIVDGELTLAGQGLLSAVAVTVMPRAVDGGVVAEVDTIRIGGAAVDVEDLPPFLAPLLGDITDGFDVPLGLPEDVGVDTVDVTDEGLHATMSGNDVALDELTLARS